jgi:phosphoserine phosphatase RsbU/P
MTIDWERGVRDPLRLAAVDRLGLVDSPPEDAFDRLAELATALTGVARACITLVDSERTTAKSCLGFPEGAPRSAPIEQSFCRFVVGSGRPLIVDDARLDPRTCGDPAIEAYDAASWAGYPIEDPAGIVLGTFCLMDPSPHEWTASDIHILATLAKAASSEIALRDADRMRSASAARHAALVAHLRDLVADGEPAAVFAAELLDWLGPIDGAPDARPVD